MLFQHQMIVQDPVTSIAPGIRSGTMVAIFVSFTLLSKSGIIPGQSRD